MTLCTQLTGLVSLSTMRSVMNWDSITAGDLLMLDNYKIVLVLSTEPVEPFYDYGLDVCIKPIGYEQPFWIKKNRLSPLPCDLLH